MGRISDFRIIKRSALPALSVRSQVALKDLAAEMEEARNKLDAYLELMDEFPAGPFYVIYHSFSRKEVDMEAGYPVSLEIEGEEEIEPAELPAGLHLVCVHRGAAKEIPRVYKEMDAWLEEHHFETSGISEEIYLNTGEAPEEEQITQILIPIQKRKEI